MTDPQLQAARRAGAAGLYALEAGTGMIIAHGIWPAREDSRRFVRVADSLTDPGAELGSWLYPAEISRVVQAGQALRDRARVPSR